MNYTSVLIVEDDEDDFRSICQQLQDDSSVTYKVSRGTSLAGFFRAMQEQSYDAILLDLGLPDSVGLETLQSVRDYSAETPIVILTELEDRDFAEHAVRLGFEEYVPKTALLSSRIDWQILQAIERHKITRSYYKKATVDGLSGVYNRSYFDEVLERSVSEHQRTGQPLALALMDIDDFKQVNDQHGHAIGDAVLGALGDSLNACKRTEDVAARNGGDEFVLLFTQMLESDELVSKQFFDRLTGSFEHRCKAIEGLDSPPSISMGLAWLKQGMTSKELYLLADHAMYKVKGGGKKGVRVV